MNARQRRLRWRKADRHNQVAAKEMEATWRLLSSVPPSASGVDASVESWEGLRGGWRRSVSRFPVVPLKRTAFVVVQPHEDNNFEGEYVTIELDADGKELSRKSRSLKGMRA